MSRRMKFDEKNKDTKRGIDGESVVPSLPSSEETGRFFL